MNPQEIISILTLIFSGCLDLYISWVPWKHFSNDFFKLNCVFNVFIRFLCSFTSYHNSRPKKENSELAIIRVV